MEAIAQAERELQRLFNIDANRSMTIEDAVTLETLTVLERCNTNGAIAARIMVGRYGLKDE